MRTTVRIDDDLLRQLRERAQSQEVSLTDTVNQVIRQGLSSEPAKRRVFRQKTYSLGQPKVNLDKALALAAELEDEEIIRKMAAGK